MFLTQSLDLVRKWFEFWPDSQDRCSSFLSFWLLDVETGETPDRRRKMDRKRIKPGSRWVFLRFWFSAGFPDYFTQTETRSPVSLSARYGGLFKENFLLLTSGGALMSWTGPGVRAPTCSRNPPGLHGNAPKHDDVLPV